MIPSDFEYQFSPTALKEMREHLGMSQAQIAKRLNLPTNTVSRWERGETSPDANSLAAIYSIATGTGLEPEFFRSETAQPVKAPGTATPATTTLQDAWCQATEM